jgi:Zn-dependent peptidase ImmA (M78 family)/transcriptional regulator with XRE-family HTH domain
VAVPEVVLASDVARLFSGQRLRLAREVRGMSQSDLARDERVDVTSAAISQFEKPGSQVKPREATVEQLAEALDFPIGFFAVTAMPSSRPDEDLERLDGYGHFRSLRSLTAKKRREALSVTQLVRDVVYSLAQHVRLPDVAVPRVLVDVQRPPDVDAAAAEVRQEWAMADGPARDVLQLAERHGVVGIRHRIDTDAVSAYSVPFRERPVVVMHQQGAKRDRDRFSCSHEIGHLVMHDPGTELAPKDIEKQADRFASAFLMPADQIRDELPSTLEWIRFLDLKLRWQVSIGALLRRAKDLGVMSEETYLQGVRTMSARGWRTTEPGDLGTPESPRVLTQAIAVAEVSTEVLAEETGWPAELIAPVLAASADSRPEVSI